MKVPPEIGEDAFIPMEANDLASLQEHKRKRNEHWARLKRARSDCPDSPNYPKWLENTWGLRVSLSSDSMITDEYTVVDEPKYLMYLIKYSQ